MNTKVSEGGKFLAGEGASLLAIPNGNDPQILYYNKTILANCGINIVSVPESELEAYNTSNSAKLQPHGYAEYKEAPFADAISSRNEAGEFVYKVFNESIAMNWEGSYGKRPDLPSADRDQRKADLGPAPEIVVIIKGVLLGNDPSHKISKCPLRRFAEGICFLCGYS